MSEITRATHEARRDQALADLDDVEAQVADGELDQATADQLRSRYTADLIAAERALAVAPRNEGEAAPAAASTQRRSRTRTVLAGVAIVAVLAAVAFGAHAALKPREPGGSATGGISSDVAAGNTSGTTRDLSTVSNDEMEQVIAANPDVVPMRLALVERYLQAGDAKRAQGHAQEAVSRATDPSDKARALRYLGWTTALLGSPDTGAIQLQQSLTIEPNNPDALWFLAIVTYRGLNRPADAVPLLQSLLAADIPDAQRQVVTDKLNEVQAVLNGAPMPTTTPPSTP